MTRADLKHCGKIPDAREELNRSVREGRIESRHSINSLEGMICLGTILHQAANPHQTNCKELFISIYKNYIFYVF